MKHIKINQWLLVALIGFTLLATYSVTYLLKERTTYKSSAAEIVDKKEPEVFGESYLTLRNGFLRIYYSYIILPKLGFTLEARVKPEGLVNNGHVFYKGIGTQNAMLLTLSTKRDESGTDTVSYSFGVADENCAMQTVTGTKVYKKGEFNSRWTQLAGVLQDDGTLNIFVDYEKLETNTAQVKAFCKGNFPIFVGAKYLNSQQMEGYFNGSIDDVRVSNIAEYPQEVVATGTKDQVFDEPGGKDSTIVFYTFDDGFANMAGRPIFRAIPSAELVIIEPPVNDVPGVKPPAGGGGGTAPGGGGGAGRPPAGGGNTHPGAEGNEVNEIEAL